MARNQPDAPKVKYRCISCAAPLSPTVDGTHVCVECGRTFVHSHPDPASAREDGVTPVDGAQFDGTVADPSNPQQAQPSGGTDDDKSGSGSEFLIGADSEVSPTLSFVLPTKNEAGAIGACIDRVIETIEELGVTAEIVVSDSSTDRTPAIARRKGAVVVRPDTPGYGYAYKYAFERVRGEFVVMGDADMTYDFRELPKLLAPLRDGTADIVLGSRFDGEIKDGAMPLLHQYVGNPLLTRFLNFFYDADVSDAHSGFRVFTWDALERLELDSNGMEFASEMVMEAAVKGLRIEEVPITYHPRVGDAELDSFQDGWRHVKFMLTNAPTFLFLLPAVAFILSGTMAIGLSFFDIQPGVVTFGIHTMIAGSLLFIVGYQVLLLAVASSVGSNPIRKPRDRLTRLIESKLDLELGIAVGLALTALGTGYAAFLVTRWITSNFTARPLVTADMLAFTMIVVGIETLFNAFHLDALRTA